MPWGGFPSYAGEWFVASRTYLIAAEIVTRLLMFKVRGAKVCGVSFFPCLLNRMLLKVDNGAYSAPTHRNCGVRRPVAEILILKYPPI